MVASLLVASPSFFPSVYSWNKSSTHKIKSNSFPSSPYYYGGALRVKVNIAQNNNNNNNKNVKGGVAVTISIPSSSIMKRVLNNKERQELSILNPQEKGIDNKVNRWSMLLSKLIDMIADPFCGKRVNGPGIIFRQNIVIRSYEMCFDWKVSMMTIVNHLQDTKMSHLRSSGIKADAWGVTPEMRRKNLRWFITKMDIVVDHYPSWSDVIQVDTWTSGAGTNGVRCDWLFRDLKTGKSIVRATSFYVMVDKKTKKLSKFNKQVRKELEPYFMHNGTFFEEGGNKNLPPIDKSSVECIRTGLRPRWIDLHRSQHIGKAKYIGWILESTPEWASKSYELYAMNMEYQKECGPDSVLKSLTVSGGDIAGDTVTDDLMETKGVKLEHSLCLENGTEIARARTIWSQASGGDIAGDTVTDDLMETKGVKLEHSLCLENGTEIARARTIWRPKYANNFKNVAQVQPPSSLDS